MSTGRCPDGRRKADREGDLPLIDRRQASPDRLIAEIGYALGRVIVMAVVLWLGSNRP